AVRLQTVLLWMPLETLGFSIRTPLMNSNNRSSGCPATHASNVAASVIWRSCTIGYTSLAGASPCAPTMVDVIVTDIPAHRCYRAGAGLVQLRHQQTGITYYDLHSRH